jgi:hypothetical protein
VTTGLGYARLEVRPGDAIRKRPTSIHVAGHGEFDDFS